MTISIRRYFRYFDWTNLITTCLLLAIGLLAVFSATYKPQIPYSLFFKKQAIGIISAFVIYIACTIIDYRTLCRWGFYAYFSVILLLIITIIKGSIGMGAQRWINLFFFKIQPSELTKLLFPAFFSSFLVASNDKKPPTTIIIFTFIILAITTILVIKQPDLGTGLIIFISGLLMLWFAGASNRFFMILGISAACIIPLGPYVLKPYQKKRIEVFLGQGSYHKERYQLEQSKIAIGSGGLLGKGFLQGTQNTFRFLPEGRTDFIFSVICEEWGFLGGLSVIILFCILFGRLFYLLLTLKHHFSYVFGIGLLLPFILATLINICMVLGLMPIVGIPLPLISYGLSNLWITMATLGVLNNIAIRRFYR